MAASAAVVAAVALEQVAGLFWLMYDVPCKKLGGSKWLFD